jgi:aquaporin Z
LTRTSPALAPETEAAPRWATLRAHWPEYLSELGGLAWVMLAAGTVAAVIWYPGSPVGRAVTAEPARRMLMGVGMATAVVAFVYSPWGKRSGAHLNPAITLSFLFLGKIRARDAVFYIGAQFCGAILGVLIFAGLAGAWASDSHVNYIVTVPGQWGASAAFAAEFGITFAMMTLVLMASNAVRELWWAHDRARVPDRAGRGEEDPGTPWPAGHGAAEGASTRGRAARAG